MNVKYMFSLVAVLLLILLSYAGAEAAGMKTFFGIFIPYIAVAVFLIGFIWKIVGWAKSPVPFRIPSTCGQQKSLPWMSYSYTDSPYTKTGVVLRMALEVLLFRSLFRNTKFEQHGDRLAYRWEKWLWLFALLFHYAFLVTVIRHLRFFAEPVPFFVQWLEELDGFLQLGLPGLFLSGVALAAAGIFLLLRRMYLAEMRYISLPSDYFPLFLIIGIAVSGIMMRYFTKVDVVAVKELTLGLVTFGPTIPEGVGGLFYVHMFLVCVLLIYFPFSKLMHLGGIFMSPTRNLPNNSRAVRHVNPWNYPVKVHTYEEYEEEFRDKMVEAGLPVEKGA
jgi:nitrate reductase gamma subunit